MLPPTAHKFIKTMENLAQRSSVSQPGPLMPRLAKNVFKSPKLPSRIHCQSRATAAPETTLGRKKIVRNTRMPNTFWFIRRAISTPSTVFRGTLSAT